MNALVDVSAHDLQVIRSILAEYLPEMDVYAFGSRVGGRPRPASDLDLAVMTQRPLDARVMADLREAFSESELPFKVDIADWASISGNFRKRIDENRTLIRSGSAQQNTTEQ